MKTLFVLAASAIALGACASAGTDLATNTAPPPAGFEASAGQFEGWARVEGGEIRLYAMERDLANPVAPCVSGALPRNPQRIAGDLNGSKIRLFGRTAAWSERTRATYDWQGSDIVNRCRRDVVILADRVEVLR